MAVLAATLHGVCDVMTYGVAMARPPYLRLGDAPEAFQMLSPVAVSVAVSCISGVIAVIAVAALAPPQRRPLMLGGLVTGFWLFSAVLLRALWLSTPWTTTLLASLFGVPRGFAVGWCLARISAARLTASTGGGA